MTQALFKAVAQVMADLLHHFRKRSVSQTCHAFAKAARCLYELARLELTLRLAPSRRSPPTPLRLPWDRGRPRPPTPP